MSLPLLKKLYAETVEVVQPHRRIPQLVKVEGDKVWVGEDNKKEYALRDQNCYVVGFGKAVSGMAAALEEILGDHLKRGVISVPKGSQEIFKTTGKSELLPSDESRIEVFEGAEDNIPDEDALHACEEIVALIAGLTDKDVLFVLVSGGGSSLLPMPTPPITLREKCQLIRDLSRAGASIQELNSIRKRISLVKGGKLVQIAKETPTVSFILSDIIGDPIDLISSSPTVKNIDSPELAKYIMDKYSKEVRFPDSVVKVLEKEEDKDNKESFKHVQNLLIGNIDLALDAMVASCAQRGFSALTGSNKVSGEAKTVGQLYAKVAYYACLPDPEKRLENLLEKFEIYPNVLRQFIDKITDLKENGIPLCLINGGETTVRVAGNGKGGRNQELTLAFAQEFDKLCRESEEGSPINYDVFFMSAGTDGIDGPTNAAGAIAYNNLVADAKNQGLDVSKTLQDNDSYTFFSQLNGGRELLKVGHTGTNVMDVHLLSICTK